MSDKKSRLMSEMYTFLAESCEPGDLKHESLAAAVHDCQGVDRMEFHPLGFVQLPLRIPTKSDRKVRLHIWLPNIRKIKVPSYPIHRHSMHLKSFVVSGMITNLTWSFRSRDNGDYKLYDVISTANQHHLVTTGLQGDLHLQDHKRIKSHEEYDVSTEHFHSTEVDVSSATITLCVTKLDLAAKGACVAVPHYASPFAETSDSVDCLEEHEKKVLRDVVNSAGLGAL